MKYLWQERGGIVSFRCVFSGRGEEWNGKERKGQEIGYGKGYFISGSFLSNQRRRGGGRVEETLF